MPRRSAGLLLYRPAAHVSDGVEVLLGHMGGPLWVRRERAWTLPKGEYGEDEDPFAAACREFEEELGSPPPLGDRAPVDLGEVRQSGGKLVRAWAVAADFDATSIVSNTVRMPWPPRSGRVVEFPEIDRAAWFDLDAAAPNLVQAQVTFLERLQRVQR